MLYQLALLIALAVSSYGYHLDLDFMTSDDMERYFSVRNPEEVPEYEIVSPSAYSVGGRRKRHIEVEESSKEIKVQAFGEEYHMKLDENTQLLADGLHVEKHNADGTIDKLPLKSRRCFYHGHLLSHEISEVAVSTCNGLSGMIATDTHDMYIRPLTEEHADRYKRKRRDLENPHIIYRKSVDQEDVANDPNAHYCALDPSEYPDEYTMLHKSMEEMDEMHRSMANGPVEIYVDSADEETTTPADGNNNDNSEEGAEDAGSSNGKPAETSSRKKRASSTKYLEVRVMADSAMVEYYNESGVMDYTLTLMNIVAARYADVRAEGSSVAGRTIIIHIVQLGYFTGRTLTQTSPYGQDVTLTSYTDGPSYLNSWSNFQYGTNPFSDGDPGHYDNAVLITGENIAINGSPNLQGIAWGASTCFLPQQASVSQDNGLSSGLVIAHEIGHTLGINHDIDNGCENGVNLMSTQIPNGPRSFAWSSCSVANLESFLEDRFKTCLDDQPITTSQWPIDKDDKPGSAITANEQCRRLSPRFTGFCSTTTILEDICGYLPCQGIWGGCSSTVAAAEGTACGTGKWCVSGKCVDKSNNNNNNRWVVTDGQCSVTCGTGIIQQVVRCYSQTANNYVNDVSCDPATKPTPQQIPCVLATCPSANQWQTRPGTCSASCGYGEAVDSVECVSSSGQVLHDSQCDSSTKPPSPEIRQCFDAFCPAVWQPLNFGPCSVTCGIGTQTLDVWCVRSNGQNLERLVDSECDSATKPATTQQCANPTSCAVWVTSSFTQCSVTCGAGTRTRTVNCRPVATSSQVLDDSQCQGTKPDSTEHCNEQACHAGYLWLSSSGSCSVTCGSGTQTTVVQCYDSSINQFVPDSFCASGPRPPVTSQPCTRSPCPTSFAWETTSFSQCSVTCGQGVQQRQVFCRSSTSSSINLPDFFCDPDTKPATQQICTRPCSLGIWHTTAFEECSVTCGDGTKTRTVTCRPDATSSQVLDDSQCQGTKPVSVVDCNEQACHAGYSWSLSSGSCSVTCGSGTQTTVARCYDKSLNQFVPDSFCASEPRPPVTSQPCTQSPCPTSGVWGTSSFSQCSHTCGQGVQHRQVFCRSSATNTRLLESDCDPNTKPATQQPCNSGDCPSTIAPDQGVECAGLFTRPVSDLDRLSVRTNGCDEIIVAQPGQTIKLTFNEFYLPCSQAHRMTVQDGSQTDNYAYDFCGNNNLDDNGNPYTWTSTNHFITLTGFGYAVTVEFIGQPRNGCDRLFTSPTGTVTSPNYPSNYPNNQRCHSVIIAPPGKRVDLQYDDISLNSHPWCQYGVTTDKLEVFDYDTGEGYRYCGSQNNPSAAPQPQHNDKVLVRFVSDNSGTAKGFSISYAFGNA